MGRATRVSHGARTAIAEWRAFGHPRYRTFLGIGVCAAVVGALVGDGLTVPLLLEMGAHPAVATAIGVLPVACSAAQLRVPWLLERSDGDLRSLTLVILAIGELRGFLLAVITLLAWAGAVPPAVAVAGIGVIMSLGGAATTIGGTNLLAWYGAILPDAERRFVAPRVMGITLGLGAVLLLPVALLVQATFGTFGTRVYAVIFAAAGLAGIVELATARRLPRPGRVRIPARPAGSPPAPQPGLEPFIRSITFAAFGAGFGPYLSIYSISVLGLPPSFAILLSALSSGASLIASTVVGGVLGRSSASRMLRLSFLMRGGGMFLGIFAFPGQPYAWLVLCGVAIVASAGAAVGTLAANERLMRLVLGPALIDAQGRFVAMSSLGITVGQLANGVILGVLPLAYTTFAGLFLVSGITRLIVATRAEVSATWGTSTAAFRIEDLRGGAPGAHPGTGPSDSGTAGHDGLGGGGERG
ncbi:MAG TPA: hypothetical protein VEG29_00295 [Candidatus Binatia bacterium]|nr:hypothetical protein [Candidatus Binatia bacterium]